MTSIFDHYSLMMNPQSNDAVITENMTLDPDPEWRCVVHAVCAFGILISMRGTVGCGFGVNARFSCS